MRVRARKEGGGEVGDDKGGRSTAARFLFAPHSNSVAVVVVGWIGREIEWERGRGGLWGGDLGICQALCVEGEKEGL